MMILRKINLMFHSCFIGGRRVILFISAIPFMRLNKNIAYNDISITENTNNVSIYTREN